MGEVLLDSKRNRPQKFGFGIPLSEFAGLVPPNGKMHLDSFNLIKASMEEANLGLAVGAMHWESVVGSMTIQRLVSQSCERS